MGTLLASVLWFDGRFDGSYLILALLVFSMTFPSSLGWGTASARRLIRDIVTDWVAIIGLLLLLGWVSRTLDAFDQRAILAWTLVTPVLLFAAHRLTPVILARVLATPGLHRTAVIVGGNELGRRLADRICANPFLGIHLAGYFDDRRAERLPGIKQGELHGSLEQLADFVRMRRVDVIYVALPMCPQPRIRKLLEDLYDTTASIYFVPDILMVDLIQGRMDTIGGIPVLAVCESPYYGLSALIKRASDLV